MYTNHKRLDKKRILKASPDFKCYGIPKRSQRDTISPADLQNLSQSEEGESESEKISAAASTKSKVPSENEFYCEIVYFCSKCSHTVHVFN